MIWVDHREIRSGVLEELRKLRIAYELRNLAVGDYLINHQVVIERKTSRDFVYSIYSGRLFEQISRLKRFGGRHLLIIEGLPPGMLSGARPEAIRGALITLAVTWRLPILFSECPAETARFLELILRRSVPRIPRPGYPEHRIKKVPDSVRYKKRILQDLPLIGPKLADALLKQFGSLSKVFEATEEELRSLRGIGVEKAKRIRDVLKETKAEYKI